MEGPVAASPTVCRRSRRARRTVEPNIDFAVPGSRPSRGFHPRQGSRRTVEQIIDIPVSRTRDGGGLPGVHLQQGSTARGGAHAWLRRGVEELQTELENLLAIMAVTIGAVGSRYSASWLVWTRVAALYGSGMCLAGIACYFGMGPLCDSVALVSLAFPRWISLRTASVFRLLRGTLLVMGACMMVHFTLSFCICVHVVWSGLRAIPSLSHR